MQHRFTGTASREGEGKYGLAEGEQYEMDKIGKIFIVYSLRGDYITVATDEAFGVIKENSRER